MKVDYNNQNNFQKFRGLSGLAKPLGAFYNKNATIPTLTIETGVTLGRAHEANKQSGKKEALERLVEQGTSAIVWIFGVQWLKNIGEFIGKKFFNIKDFNFDIGFDELRNPMKNCSSFIDKKACNFKMGNLLISTALATYFTGFILPKINYKISSHVKNKKDDKTTLKPTSFKDFQDNLAKDKKLSFKGGFINTLSHTIENDSTMRLLITDMGVVSGRCVNARSKNEKIENLFRDISSIYLYLRASDDIAKALNILTKNASINPRALNSTIKLLEKNLDKINKDNFSKVVLGSVKNKDLEALNNLFQDKTIVKTDDFIKAFPNLEEKALKMATLQPIIEENGVLSKQQAKDVLNNGLLSNPEFLKEMFKDVTNGASDDIRRFVSKKDLEKIRASLDNFALQIERGLNNEEGLTKELLEKIGNKNIRKNFLNNSIGTFVSIVGLGFIIPKVQYLIRNKLENKNKATSNQNKQG